MMKIAFFVSSAGDTDLALSTMTSMARLSEYEIVLVALTQTAQTRLKNVSSTLPLQKTTLPEILHLGPDSYLDGGCDAQQLNEIVAYIKDQGIHSTFFGVPSVNNAIPFQIATALDIPVLMAYEFMFKPELHCLWGDHLDKLKNKPNVQWAIPLAEAANDIGDDSRRMHMVGHISIDNAFSSNPNLNIQETQRRLNVTSEQSLAVVSSTTQPTQIDELFLDTLLAELPNHPQIQLRLSLHPGIEDLDAYLAQIVAVTLKYPQTNAQFNIILPDNLFNKLNKPELSVTHTLFQHLFLRENISGPEAATAADRIAQAVPGALLNQAALEGKPAFSSSGKPYLNQAYFSKNAPTFFVESRQSPRTKQDLGLDEQTVGTRCANIITNKSETHVSPKLP